MGGSQSTNSEVVSATAPVVPAMSDEKAMDINQALNAVAAQVYDNVHEQLENIQQEQLKRSMAMAVDIRKKMEPVGLINGQVVCDAQSKSVVECLRSNKTEPLKCEAFVEALSRCSAAAADAQ